MTEEINNVLRGLGKRFVCVKVDGKSKIPVDPLTGYAVDPHSTANQHPYDYVSSTGYHVGFVITDAPDDPFFLFDMDNCRTPDGTAWTAEAERLCALFRERGAAIEVSSSGTGLHAWGVCNKAAVSGATHRNKFTTPGGLDAEFYTSRRLVTFGQWGWQGDPRADCTDVLGVLAPRRETPQGGALALAGTCPVPDAQVMITLWSLPASAARAFGATPHPADLWNAKADALARWRPARNARPDGLPFDYSDADAGLMMHLARMTHRDPAAMERLFGMSALGKREKWIGTPGYRKRTIEGAIGACGDAWNYDRPAGAVVDTPRLITGANRRPKWCAENGRIVLETTPEWQGVLAFNELTQQVVLLKHIPGTPGRPFNEPREFSDADLTRALTWFNRNGYPDAKLDVLYRVLEMVAREAIISPVRHYLEDLTHDGTPRIDTWLTTYFGAADTPYVRSVGRAWLISAVARALRPGCKVDTALVLESPQGKGKSSAIAALCGQAWFSDGLPDMHSKDAKLGLRGKWIIEIAELGAINRSDVDMVKAFLSRTEEKYRPPYGKVEVCEPRRCVFIGTVNPGGSGYLKDDTGNRRFWPVAVTRADQAGIALDRSQLWAEAVAAYRAGERWWLDEAGEALAQAEQAERAEQDPWTGQVLVIAEMSVAQHGAVSARHILAMIPGADQGKRESMRVAGILGRNGWKADGRFTQRGSSDRFQTRWVPGATG